MVCGRLPLPSGGAARRAPGPSAKQPEAFVEIHPRDARRRGIEQAVEEARDRTLTESELSAIGKALDGMEGNPGAILAIRLAAITGLRIGEVRTMRWADIDFEGGAVVLPQTKTGRRIHTLPSAALALLSETPRLGACVIPGRNPDNPLDYRSVQRHWARACEAAKV